MIALANKTLIITTTTVRVTSMNNKAKAISAKLLELNLKNKLE